MPFDPNFPPDHQALNGAPFREQFQGLKQLIDDLLMTLEFQNRVFELSSGPAIDVSPLELTVSDPPTQAEVQAIADKIDQLLFQLKRL